MSSIIRPDPPRVPDLGRDGHDDKPGVLTVPNVITVARIAGSGVMLWLAYAGFAKAFVALFAIALTLGALGGVFLLDREPSVNCDEAREVVDTAVASMEEINQAEEQDQSFFAAIIVEQRAITYAMGAEPSCFSLTERAAAEGLLEGLRGLLGTAPG